MESTPIKQKYSQFWDTQEGGWFMVDGLW